MWSKLSNALKPRPAAPDQTPDPFTSLGDVMSSIYEQHPNLSVFQGNEDLPFPAPSPPGSPSKHGRKGKFKRASKVVKEGSESLDAPSSLRMPVGLPKKVRSTLSLNSNSVYLLLHPLI